MKVVQVLAIWSLALPAAGCLFNGYNTDASSTSSNFCEREPITCGLAVGVLAGGVAYGIARANNHSSPVYVSPHPAANSSSSNTSQGSNGNSQTGSGSSTGSSGGSGLLITSTGGGGGAVAISSGGGVIGTFGTGSTGIPAH